jgi:hypothetical protein
MAVRAPDGLKLLLPRQNGGLNGRIIRNDAAGYRHGRLENRHSRDVSAGDFVYKSIAVRVSIPAEAFRRLNAMVMIEGIVGEFAE